MPVAVGYLHIGEKVIAEGLYHLCVCILYIKTRKLARIRGHGSCPVYGAESVKPLLLTYEIIIPAVPRGDVNHSGVFECDIIRRYNPVDNLFLGGDEICKRRVVDCAGEVGTCCLLYHVVIRIPSPSQDILSEFVGDPEIFALIVLYRLDFCIYEVLPDRCCDICRKGPGSGRPDDQVFVLFAFHGEFNEYRRVGLVPVFDLRIGYRGLATGAPVDNAKSLIEKSFLVRTLQYPPCRLDISGGDRLVRIVEVHPYTELLKLL